MGDYRSKRARQQRYLSRQATILRFVAEQQARHRLLLAAYTAEQHTLAETQHACTTAARAVQALSGGAHARARRTAALRRQGGALASAYRHSVDGRDLFARSIAAAASDAAATAAGAGGSGADTPGGSRARHEGAAGTGDASDGAQVGRAGGGGDGGTWAVGETWEALQERVQALAGKGSAHQGPSSGRRREEAVGSAVGHARRLWAETGLGRAAGVGDERSWTLARDPALCAALEGADARRRQLSVEVSRVLETHAQREEVSAWAGSWAPAQVPPSAGGPRLTPMLRHPPPLLRQKIRRDPVLMKGLRAMFVHFHMRPERLQREEAALKERIAGAGQR